VEQINSRRDIETKGVTVRTPDIRKRGRGRTPYSESKEHRKKLEKIFEKLTHQAIIRQEEY